MSREATWTRAPGIVARRIAGETILVPVTTRAQEMGLFTLNEVGTFVWEQLDGERPLAALAEEVSRHFEVDVPRAAADIEEFLALLAETGCAKQVVQAPGDRPAEVPA